VVVPQRALADLSTQPATSIKHRCHAFASFKALCTASSIPPGIDVSLIKQQTTGWL
jgi:hypothetical protein